MTLKLDGYRIDARSRSAGQVDVHAGERLRDQQPIVAKVCALAGQPGIAARVVFEFERIRALDCPGIVRALALERADDRLVLVFERRLKLINPPRARPVPVPELLVMARSLAEILARIHERGVLHRDVKPASILVDPASGELTLAEPGIAALLELERAHDPQRGDGSLAYLAPEQITRAALAVDVRSDLYSLGATLFELATGRPPFTGRSANELLHAQLARRPEAPQWLRPELPGAVSAVILTLLEKAPERRYQSARGLALDLAVISDRLTRGESLDEFEFPQRDLPFKLQVAHQLRGVEIDLLRERVRRTDDQGPPCLVLITGPTGVGKTALVDELLEPVLARRGYLLRGKFEGSLRPYDAIADALGDLAEQLLATGEVELRRWRQELRSELGGLASAIVELVPALATLLGPLAEPEYDATPSALATRNRLALALERLVARVGKPEHPIVLALEDIHLADPASGELLANMLDALGPALLIVASACEDPQAEVVLGLLAHQDRAKRKVVRIELPVLGPEAVAELVSASLARPQAELAKLSALIGRKAGGNPLVVGQILRELDHRQLLTIGPSGWRWELAAIEAAELPVDSVALMAAEIERLEPGPIEALELASVVGARFDLALLERVAGRSLIGDLHQLARAGLMFARGPSWSFVHERVREGALRRAAGPRLAALQIALGRALAESESAEPSAVVELLDRGFGLLGPGSITDAIASLAPRDRHELVLLNARAGARALGQGAPRAALPLLELARTLRGDGLPGLDHPDHADAVALELGYVEALSTLGQHEDAEARVRALLERGDELRPAEFAALIIHRIEALALRGDRGRALELGVKGLRRLGVGLPREPGKLAALRALLRLLARTRAPNLARLGATRATDPRACAAMQVLRAMAAFAYVTHAELFVVLVERHFGLLARHGNHPSAPLVLMQAALLLALGLDRRALAWRLAARARQLCDRDPLGEPALDYRAMMCEQYILHWEHSYRDCVPVFGQISELALEVGDLETADYTDAIRVELSFHAGIHLRLLEQLVEARNRRVARWGSADIVGAGPPMAELCRRLTQGPAPEPDDLDPCAGSELAEAGLHEISVHAGRLCSAITLVLFGCAAAALQVLDEIHHSLVEGLRGSWVVITVLGFHGLAIAASLEATSPSPSQRRARMAELRGYAKQLERWAEAGGNCQVQAELLAAEVEALSGRPHQALLLWERAADRALEQRVPMYEGIACERIAALVESEGLSTLLRSPLERARAAYRHWGAFAKVAQLEREWPLLVHRMVGASIVEDPSIESVHPSSSSAGHAVDMVSLLRTSQAIASDIRLDDVVERILTIAVENAGADRGVLLLQRGERGLSVVAEYEAARPDRTLTRAPNTVLSEPIPLTMAGDRAPGSLLRWIERTRESLVVAEISTDPRFSTDPYVAANDVRSVLGVPIIKHDQLVGLLYLEHRDRPDGFTNDRLEVIGLLIGQAASALENARLYEALRGSELRWRTLVERLPDVVAVVDREGRVEFINHLDEGPTAPGPSRAQLLDLVRATQHQAAGEHLRAAFEGQTAVVELETTAKGRARWWMVRFAPILADGRIDRVILVSTDISERREAEQQRAVLEAQLRQQQRLESIGTLASGVAHEINNPIQGIMNYAELIGSSPGVSPEIRDFADEIEHETKRVATIVRNLLAFSRQEGDRIRELVTIAGVVEGTLSLIHAVLRRDQIILEIGLPADLPALECKAQQIQQVIMNLITNARDALNVRYPGHHPDKRIDIGALAFVREGADWVRISVTDRGGGVPLDVVARIFDPFFTTKGRDQGTGLGLAVSHGIISEHGGELRLDNQLDQGATFHVELPRARPLRSN